MVCGCGPPLLERLRNWTANGADDENVMAFRRDREWLLRKQAERERRGAATVGGSSRPKVGQAKGEVVLKFSDGRLHSQRGSSGSESEIRQSMRIRVQHAASYYSDFRNNHKLNLER